MKSIIRVIKNNCKFIFGLIIGLIISITSVYAIEAYIESSKVSYNNHNKTNVEEAIDELYEKSGIHKEKWVDPILNGADPVLKAPLIPVEIKNNGDVYYANENSEWYNYSEKRWANAVILIDNPSNKNYKVGDHILEDDIESYFVWIPRYSYKIWNLGKYTTAPNGDTLTNQAYATSTTQALNKSIIIDIKFGTASDMPKMAEPTTIGVYYTHPAFTLGDKNLNGLWVGKFETGETNVDTMVVKPNVVSWRNEIIKVFFNAGKEYNPDLDSHMMKNTEWGVVAYLSHSQYGIGNEVNINNASDNYTGYSAAPNTDQSTRKGTYAEHTVTETTQPWNTPVGYLASTTGNISGIYDMSGGTWEYVAAYRKNSGEANKSGLSEEEISAQVQEGYIDEYAADSSITSYNKRILGDATGEMGPFYSYYDKDGANRSHNSWYGEASTFINFGSPWFYRSGGFNDGGIAGQFYFDMSTGAALGGHGFRLVLAPQS